MPELYVNPHRSQYDVGCSARTRRSGCTWTSGANGADASTGGVHSATPDQVLAEVRPAEETNPLSPGWSLRDLGLAMERMGVPFDVRSGSGWAGVRAAHDAGLYVVLQGDSDRFGNATCSGRFDGDHAIGVHPDELVGDWRIDDPICPSARYEAEATLRAYAAKLSPTILFGVFLLPVPRLGAGPEDDMRFVNANGAGVASSMLLNVGAGSPWTYLDGSAGGTFGAAAAVTWIGKGDAVTGEHVVQITTGVPYSDKLARPTLVRVRSSNVPYPRPPDPVPPADCSDELAAQRDADAKIVDEAAARIRAGG